MSSSQEFSLLLPGELLRWAWKRSALIVPEVLKMLLEREVLRQRSLHYCLCYLCCWAARSTLAGQHSMRSYVMGRFRYVCANLPENASMFRAALSKAAAQSTWVYWLVNNDGDAAHSTREFLQTCFVNLPVAKHARLLKTLATEKAAENIDACIHELVAHELLRRLVHHHSEFDG